jgi:hypothetical protein
MSKSKSYANRPEKKFGPYAGGVSVAVWLNQIDTDQGPRYVRAVTISPARFRDPQTGEWRDAPNYRPAHLPGILIGLQKALEYVYTEPIPGQEEEHGEAAY